MFKKKPHLKPAAPLRSSDRRKLADSIIHDYNLLPTSRQGEQLSEEQTQEATAIRTALRSSLLPENVQTAKFTTTHGPDLRQIVGTFYFGTYQDDDVRILWWQTEDRLYPSIYTIWKHPDLTALLFTPGIVIEKMQGGADLMTPGLASGPPFPERARKGAIVAVSAIERPAAPVALGICAIDVSALEQVRGAKGMAVETLHWVGDELYNFSPSERAPPATPEKVDGWEQHLMQQELHARTGDLALEEDSGGVPLEPDHPKETIEQDEPALQPDDDNVTPPLQQSEIDDAFKQAFLFGLHHYKTTNPSQTKFGLVFPLHPSFIMSDLIQPYLPIFSPNQAQQLQMKKTTWKNIKKFIKSLDKERLIKSKEMGGHETVIMDIDFDDAAIVNFRPYKLPKKESPSGTASVDKQADGADDAVGQTLEIKNFFKPSAQQAPLFAQTDKTSFTASQVKDYLRGYTHAEGLRDSRNLTDRRDQGMTDLNPILAEVVFSGNTELDRRVLAKGSIPFSGLHEKVLQAMAPSYVIVRNDTDPASLKQKSGAAPKINVTLETRSGNKTVTKVSGLEIYFIRPKPLADELRKTCAGSTTVEPLAGATKKNEKPIEEVTIQGPQQDAVIKALGRRGVSPKWIDFIDKTKGRGKGR